MTVMKRQHTLRILFAVVLVAVIAGCETVPSSGPAALVGQWTNSLGTVWTINPDGTFHVATTKPKAQIWGTYTVSGDTITVQETRQSGKVPKNCKGPGMYKFSRPDANTLAFVLVNDVCKPRIQNVTQPWHRQLRRKPAPRWIVLSSRRWNRRRPAFHRRKSRRIGRRRPLKKIDAFMRLTDFNDEPRIIPLPE